MKFRVRYSLVEFGKFEWRHRYFIILILSFILAAYFLQLRSVHEAMKGLGEFGYMGAFLAGTLFSYAFTTAPASVVLYILSESRNPILVALLGGLGAMLSDALIFKYVKSYLVVDIEIIKRTIELRVPWKRRIEKWPHWLTPIIAGFIIASPLPDEIGAALFGLAKYNSRKFVIVSYVLNTLGILAIALLANAV